MKKLGLILVACSTLVFAHKMHINVVQKDNMIIVSTQYAGHHGEACKNCELVIKKGNKPILKAKLDENGKYSYEMTTETLKYTVTDSHGHYAEKTVTIKE